MLYTYRYFDMCWQINQFLSYTFCNGCDGEFWSWKHAVDRPCSGNTLVNVMPKNTVNIYDMACACFFHHFDSLSNTHTQSNNICFCRNAKVTCVIWICEQATGDNDSIINQQVYTAIFLFYKCIGLFKGVFICNITLDWGQNATFSEQTGFEGLIKIYIETKLLEKDVKIAHCYPILYIAQKK